MALRALISRSSSSLISVYPFISARSFAPNCISVPFVARAAPLLRLRSLVSAVGAGWTPAELLRDGSAVRCFSTRPTTSSLNDPSPNWSNRPPKETILLDGCDFEHWLVVMEPPEGEPTRDDIIDSYIKTLAQVVGSEDEARMKIYSVSTRHYFAFGALVSEELSYKIKALPRVRWVLPDSYLDVKNKDYGGTSEMASSPRPVPSSLVLVATDEMESPAKDVQPIVSLPPETAVVPLLEAPTTDILMLDAPLHGSSGTPRIPPLDIEWPHHVPLMTRASDVASDGLLEAARRLSLQRPVADLLTIRGVLQALTTSYHTLGYPEGPWMSALHDVWVKVVTLKFIEEWERWEQEILPVLVSVQGERTGVAEQMIAHSLEAEWLAVLAERVQQIRDRHLSSLLRHQRLYHRFSCTSERMTAKYRAHVEAGVALSGHLASLDARITELEQTRPQF